MFNHTRNDKETLVGHLPIELSSQVDNFLKADKLNTVVAEVTGKRKQEIGLVVPAKYTACTHEKKYVRIIWMSN